jgi:hypothetical protein
MCISSHATSRKRQITEVQRSLQSCGVLRSELASCHTSGAWNFEVAPTVLENLCTPGLPWHVETNFCGSPQLELQILPFIYKTMGHVCFLIFTVVVVVVVVVVVEVKLF